MKWVKSVNIQILAHKQQLPSFNCHLLKVVSYLHKTLNSTNIKQLYSI